MVESLIANGMGEGTRRYNDFRDLEVWQKCSAIRRDVWVLCNKSPREELYRLTDQMVRASRSSPANIAEGYGRFHYQENIQFCRQARGSLYELIDHFTATEECGYLDAAACTQMIEKIKATIIKLNAYIKYLKSRKQLEK
jgi:four helix bundle protein